jgi:hypothetical protein
MGYVSTYRLPESELERILVTLAAHLDRSGVDALVLELSDGLLQAEGAALLRSPRFRAITDGVILAASDAMGAIAGVRRLLRHGLPVAGLSGVLTDSPLQGTEARTETSLPTYTNASLGRAPVSRAILARVRKFRTNNGAAHARSSDTTEPGKLAVS